MESEKVLERKVTQAVEKIGGKAIKMSSTNWNGIPDRLICLPGGMSCWVEVKSEGKKIRPLQAKRKKELEQMGFKVFVIDNSKKIEEFLNFCRSVLERGE